MGTVNLIYDYFPELTEERRKELVKDVKNVETAVGVLQEIVAMQVEEG